MRSAARPAGSAAWPAALIAAILAGCAGTASPPAMTVGTTPDPQAVLLANIYAAALRYYGTAASVQSVPDPVAALDTGAVTVTPGLTGRLLDRFAPGSTARSDSQVYRAMVGALPEGVAAADYAVAAQDKPALAVTDATAKAWGGAELAALVRNCGTVAVGALAGGTPPTTVGECTPGPAREFPDAATMFGALRAGAITAAWTTTADPGVPDGVVVLADRKPALVAAENVVALYRRNELDQMQLRAVNELAGVLDTASLTDMLEKVNAGADPRAVAEGYLADNPLGR